jgi:hypothetical protein
MKSLTKERGIAMKANVLKLVSVITLVIILALVSGCFIFEDVEQPTTATAGSQIQAHLTLSNDGPADINPKYGIIGLMIPDDWQIDSVYYSGAYGTGFCTYLNPDSCDGNPGGAVDYRWAARIDTVYPADTLMHWIVYQSNQSYTSSADTNNIDYVDLYIDFIVGDLNGTYDIGYFNSNAGLDFTDSTYYAASLNHTIEVTGGTAVEENGIVDSYFLSQNYPNPFNPTTTISYTLENNTNVVLTVFDVLGRKINELVNGAQVAGNHSVNFSAENLSTGIYFYELRTQSFTDIRKMVYMK